MAEHCEQTCDTTMYCKMLVGLASAASLQLVAVALTVDHRVGDAHRPQHVPQAAQEPAVQHAMQVREAVCTHDWSAFFQLYACAPNMGRALLDMAAPSMRWTALNALVKTFKPSVAVPFVARVLGFAPRLADPSRPASASVDASQPPADDDRGAESPMREPGLPSGAGLSGQAGGATPPGGVSDDCVAGTASAAGDAALQVLPGCSQAVYKGKYQAAVRMPTLLNATAGCVCHVSSHCSKELKGQPQLATCNREVPHRACLVSLKTCVRCVG